MGRNVQGGVHREDCSRMSAWGGVFKEESSGRSAQGGVDMKVPKQGEKDIFRDWRSVGEIGISTDGS